MSSEKVELAFDLAYMADHPDEFTKEEMAGALRKAAAKMQADAEKLRHIRGVLVEAAGAVAGLEDQLAAAIIIKGRGTADER